jgi:hypothetical protein
MATLERFDVRTDPEAINVALERDGAAIIEHHL